MSRLARGYLGRFTGKTPEVIITVHTTYLEAFADTVERRRELPVLTFLADGTGDGVTWTYGELDREARRVAGQLREKVAPGSTVLLMAEPGLDYLAGFYGCIYAGVIAVPAYPPSPMHGRANQERLQAVAKSAGVSVGLTTDATMPSLADFAVDGTPLQWICISRDAPVDMDSPLPRVGADDVVFLQYTSGSTGDPKGVIVTQGNLHANMTMIRETCDLRPGAVMVSWLPPYHDMGLIGTLLVPAGVGARTVFMPPAVFLRRPVRWLQAISRFQAFISPAPNFAYAACIEKVKDADLADLDLSSWKVAINGAEPVRASTVERFIERFGQCGFSPTALRPAYGLAETTLLASGALDTGARILTVDSGALEEGTVRLVSDSGESRRLVSSGPPPAGAQIRIIDPATGVALPDGQVGEIAVVGPHVTRGYWRSPDATAERFSGDTVRTGDLGCLFDGELVVTGRIKDVLIVRGRNYYPHDIEFTVEEAHPTFRRGCGVVFAVERDDHELVVAVQEVQLALLDDPAQVVEQVRRAVTTTHGINLGAVLLTRPGTVPKTSSGKVRRSEARRMYEHETFEPVWSWESGRKVDAVKVGAG